MLNKRKIILSSIVGNTLEFYDFALYGAYVHLFNEIFFPPEDPSVGLIASLITYAVGFLMRPLGGIFFGHLGDRVGRKKSLMLSIILMALPTACIGMIPSYASIGITAPILLLLCRLLQGFCTGGELNGAIIFLIEHVPHNKSWFSGSFASVSGAAGALIASITAFITLQQTMPSWSWRVSFFLGLGLIGVGFFIRKRMPESPLFEEYMRKNNLARIPLFLALKKSRRAILCTIGGAAFVSVLASTIIVYLNLYLTKEIHLSSSMSSLISSISLVAFVSFCPVAGYLAEKYGFEKVMSFGAWGIVILILPLFLLPNFDSIGGSLIAAVFLGILAASYTAPFNAFMVMLFPPNTRYSGSAIGYNIGVTAFGGTMPLIATFMKEITGISLAFCLYIIVIGLIGALVVQNGKLILQTR